MSRLALALAVAALVAGCSDPAPTPPADSDRARVSAGEPFQEHQLEAIERFKRLEQETLEHARQRQQEIDAAAGGGG